MCNSVSLEIIQEKLFVEETGTSKAMRAEDEYWEVEWINLDFIGALKCRNCSNYTMFGGVGNVEHFVDYDQITGEMDEGYYNSLKPRYFQPPLYLFTIAEDCPQIVKDEIISSFKLFWFDLSSCANKIRISLELLLNHEKVKRFIISKGKRNKITLHNRIAEFKKKKPEVASYLEAIKWIGNSGSHIGNLRRIDLLEAYELLEHSLNKLYNDKEPQLKKMSKEIIARRGIRKRK